MKNVIVTGANGFIGSSLIKKLIEMNISVVAIDISFDKARISENTLVKTIEVNLDDEEKLESVIPIREYDAFYHLAWAGVNGPDKADPVIQLKNVEMSINCAKIAKKIKCKKFLCAGTIAERALESLPRIDKVSGE